MGKEFQEFLQEELNRDANEIMHELDSAPELAALKVPPEVKEDLMKKIQEHKEKEAYHNLSEENKEYIRIGKETIRKKKMNKKKYLILAATLIMAMAFSVTTMGEPLRKIKVTERIVNGRKEIVISTDSDGIIEEGVSEEDEAYQEVEDAFGFSPVRMNYVPEGMEFQRVEVQKESEMAQVHYRRSSNEKIVLHMKTYYREGSMTYSCYDEIVREYTIEKDDVSIKVIQFFVEEIKQDRWVAYFSYQNIQYFLAVIGVEEAEFEKIVENLNFL